MEEERGTDSAVLQRPDPEPEVLGAEDDGYFCRRCGNFITSGRHREEVDGGHEHTFVNPAGYIYRIGCFRAAIGCATVGRPTDQFSWFAGHSWAHASCTVCGGHLGWAFFRNSAPCFYGLILAELFHASR